MRYRVDIEDREAVVDVERNEGGWRVRVDEGPWQAVSGRFVQPGELRLNGTLVGVDVEGDQVSLQVHSQALSATVIDPRKVSADMAGGASEGSLTTPMPGVVVRIPVSVGDTVEAGQVVVVVEAMKMENEFKAAIAGVVESIDVEVGQALESGTLLAQISADSD